MADCGFETAIGTSTVVQRYNFEVNDVVRIHGSSSPLLFSATIDSVGSIESMELHSSE